MLLKSMVYLNISSPMHTSSPNFFRGGIGPKWKSGRTKMKIRSENFSRASGAQKKGFPNFSPAAGFFSLWRHWKPLKTVKKPLKPLKTLIFWHFFPKTVKFFKKGTPKIFRLRRAFFQKSPRSILRKSSVKVGGSKTYFTPLWRGMTGIDFGGIAHVKVGVIAHQKI